MNRGAVTLPSLDLEPVYNLDNYLVLCKPPLQAERRFMNLGGRVTFFRPLVGRKTSKGFSSYVNRVLFVLPNGDVHLTDTEATPKRSFNWKQVTSIFVHKNQTECALMFEDEQENDLMLKFNDPPKTSDSDDDGSSKATVMASNGSAFRLPTLRTLMHVAKHYNSGLEVTSRVDEDSMKALLMQLEKSKSFQPPIRIAALHDSIGPIPAPAIPAESDVGSRKKSSLGTYNTGSSGGSKNESGGSQQGYEGHADDFAEQDLTGMEPDCFKPPSDQKLSFQDYQQQKPEQVGVPTSSGQLDDGWKPLVPESSEVVPSEGNTPILLPRADPAGPDGLDLGATANASSVFNRSGNSVFNSKNPTPSTSVLQPPGSTNYQHHGLANSINDCPIDLHLPASLAKDGSNNVTPQDSDDIGPSVSSNFNHGMLGTAPGSTPLSNGMLGTAPGSTPLGGEFKFLRPITPRSQGASTTGSETGFFHPTEKTEILSRTPSNPPPPVDPTSELGRALSILHKLQETNYRAEVQLGQINQGFNHLGGNEAVNSGSEEERLHSEAQDRILYAQQVVTRCSPEQVRIESAVGGTDYAKLSGCTVPLLQKTPVFQQQINLAILVSAACKRAKTRPDDRVTLLRRRDAPWL